MSELENVEEPRLERLWQLLFSCCDAPKPFVLSNALTDIEPRDVMVVCVSCGRVH